MEVALQHLSAVLKLVQLPAGHLMPLLRLASQTIVTNGVEVLRIKALGLLLASLQLPSCKCALCHVLSQIELPALAGHWANAFLTGRLTGTHQVTTAMPGHADLQYA